MVNLVIKRDIQIILIYLLKFISFTIYMDNINTNLEKLKDLYVIYLVFQILFHLFQRHNNISLLISLVY